MLALLLAVQIASDPQITVAELRKEVDPVVRLAPVKIPPSQNGWNLAMAAAKSPNTSALRKLVASDFEVLRKGQKPKPPHRADNVNDLLTGWSKAPTADLVARAKKVLLPYEPRLALLAQAAMRPRWVPPAMPDNVIPKETEQGALDFPKYAALKELVKALMVRARMDLAAGQPAKAVDDLLLARTTGERLAGGDNVFIAALVGIAIEAIADRQIQVLASDPHFTIYQLRRMLAALPAERTTARFAGTLRVEFDRYALRGIASIVDPLKSYGAEAPENQRIEQAIFSGHPRPFDRRDTVRLASSLLKEEVLNATRPWPRRVDTDARIDALSSFWPKDLDPPVSADAGEESQKAPTGSQIAAARTAVMSVPNPIGRMLVGIYVGVFDEADRAERRSLADLRATAVILAAQIERRRNGSWPASLSALVKPGLLKSAPLDPFGEKALHYDPKRMVLWSVGPNGKDDGGKDRPRMIANAKDYVWKLPSSE